MVSSMMDRSSVSVLIMICLLSFGRPLFSLSRSGLLIFSRKSLSPPCLFFTCVYAAAQERQLFEHLHTKSRLSGSLRLRRCFEVGCGYCPLELSIKFCFLCTLLYIIIDVEVLMLYSAINLIISIFQNGQVLMDVILQAIYNNYISAIMSQPEMSAYEKYITCLGNCCGCLCCTFEKVQTSDIGFMERFGKFKQSLAPGLNYYTPFVERIRPISLKTRVVDMPKQSIYTKDNMSVFIDTALFYRVVDPYKATYIVSDVLASIMQLTFVTLRTVCGQYVLQDLLYKRQEVNDKIEEFVRQESAEWGIYVEYLLLKDMILSNYLSENLSKVSKTKRLVESKIISAKADLESAKLYREAADILDIDAAMQIRFLETLQQMKTMKSRKTMILPLQPQYDL